jgi:hypothetical protein
MNGWRLFVQLHIQAEAEQANRHAEEKVKQQRIRNIILRLRNRQADLALQKWKQCIANTKRHRALIERAARRVVNIQVTAVQQKQLPIHVGDRILKVAGSSVVHLGFEQLVRAMKQEQMPLTIEFGRPTSRPGQQQPQQRWEQQPQQW